MARLRTYKWCAEMISLGRWARVKAYRHSFILKTGDGSGPLFTVRQARRLAKWINERCDEFERQSDAE